MIQIRKNPSKPIRHPADIDRRTPGGRLLPF